MINYTNKISNKQLAAIKKQLPNDFYKHCTRNLSLLTLAVFVEAHIELISKIFKVRFSKLLLLLESKQIIFYRSEKEYYDYISKVGEKFKQNNKLASDFADKLKQKTDYLYNFIKQNNSKKKFLEKKLIFLEKYLDFFIYHQSVYWGGDYLTKLNNLTKREKNKINKIIKILDEAFKYNELLIPKLEVYFKKWHLANLLPEELKNNHKITTKYPTRGLLFINQVGYILNNKQVNILKKAIEEKERKKIHNKKEVKGLSVNQGLTKRKIKGRVKLVIKLDELKNVKKGDILVAPITRPQFNKNIKKAKAIITDEGGLLGHTSIVAREYNIPCIVGTKIATKIFKNGDIVEMDTNKGIIKKIAIKNSSQGRIA